MKNYLHFIIITIAAFAIHKYLLLPQLEIEDTVPVLFQHLLLGGAVLLIYAVGEFMIKNFFSTAGLAILGFTVLKMVVLLLFVNAYSVEIKAQPTIKYILVGFYFLYLIVLLLKIIPLLNISLPKNTDKDLNNEGF